MTVRIVTDSTCDLPAQVIEELGITIVPLYINVGEQGFLDGVEISRQEFYANLPDYPTHPTTGTPGIDSFTQVYSRLAAEGATAVLSIHISENLSATVDVARTAASQFEQIPVHVHDSRQLSLGTGFQVETAARMAQAGSGVNEIIDALQDLAERTFVAAGLQTLEYLRRSGRMNRFIAGIGSLLQLKPILTMQHGLPGSERVRTSTRAISRLIEMIEEQQPIERFALLHTHAGREAARFKSRIQKLIPNAEVWSMDITPVLGAHIGPGAVGFALIKKPLPVKSG